MLHLTSLVQNASRSNTPSSKLEHLKRLNKNRSFVYNSALDRYEYLYNKDDDEESCSTQHRRSGHMCQGFFGCFRDKNADFIFKVSSLHNQSNNSNKEQEFLAWGQFRDTLYSEASSSSFSSTSSSPHSKDIVGNDHPHHHSHSQPIFFFEPDTELNPSIKNADAVAPPQVKTKKEAIVDLEKKEKREEEAKKLVYDLKRSQFKIEAASKRDAQMKMLIQNLEDREHQLKKVVVKKFEKDNEVNSQTQNQKLKRVNFLHFSNKTSPSDQQQDNNESKSKKANSPDSISSFLKTNFQLISRRANSNLDNFKSVFNVLSRLNKSINIFNGDFNLANLDKNFDHFAASFFNVNAAQADLNGLLYNYSDKKIAEEQLHPQLKEQKNNKNVQKKLSHSSTTISLCSNIFDKSQRPFGYSNHSTMLFEHNRVKIGFMALVDQSFYNRLNNYLNNNEQGGKGNGDQQQVEYVDFVVEANRISSQLRLSGAQIIVALINFDNDEANEARLLSEANDLDLVFSSQTNNIKNYDNNEDEQKMNIKKVNNKWLVKSANNFDSISLVSLQLDEQQSNKIVDIEFTKYHVEA